MRARCAVEEIRKDREAIIVTEIPYQVNKALLQERIAELVRDKRIEGISDIRDESDRHGMRVVIELKRDASSRGGAEPALPLLRTADELRRQHAGAERRPPDADEPEGDDRRLRRASARRSSPAARKFDLTKARDRGHILVGLAVAVANIDEVIQLIRAAPDAATAREQLMARAWPAKDVAPLVALIADPRHVMAGGRHDPPVRGAGQGHPGSAPAAPDRAGPRRDQRRSRRSWARRSRIISTSCRSRAARAADHPRRTRARSATNSPRRARPN